MRKSLPLCLLLWRRKETASSNKNLKDAINECIFFNFTFCVYLYFQNCFTFLIISDRGRFFLDSQKLLKIKFSKHFHFSRFVLLPRSPLWHAFEVRSEKLSMSKHQSGGQDFESLFASFLPRGPVSDADVNLQWSATSSSLQRTDGGEKKKIQTHRGREVERSRRMGGKVQTVSEVFALRVQYRLLFFVFWNGRTGSLFLIFVFSVCMFYNFEIQNQCITLWPFLSPDSSVRAAWMESRCGSLLKDLTVALTCRSGTIARNGKVSRMCLWKRSGKTRWSPSCTGIDRMTSRRRRCEETRWIVRNRHGAIKNRLVGIWTVFRTRCVILTEMQRQNRKEKGKQLSCWAPYQ